MKISENVKNFIKNNQHLFNENSINKFFKEAYYNLGVTEIQELASILNSADIKFTGEQIFKEFSDYKMHSPQNKYNWAVQLLGDLDSTFNIKVEFPPVDILKFLPLLGKNTSLEPIGNQKNNITKIDTMEILPWVRVKGQEMSNIVMIHFSQKDGQGILSFVDNDVEDYEDANGELFRVLPDIGIGYNSTKIKDYINQVKDYILDNVVKQLIS